MCKNLAMNELRLSNIASLLTDGARMPDAKIKEFECPGWIALEKDMNDDSHLVFWLPNNGIRIAFYRLTM